ncbi:MAG: sigma-54 dependent transcriptional regulator, partial [Bryobacteraceae bacterium]
MELRFLFFAFGSPSAETIAALQHPRYHVVFARTWEDALSHLRQVAFHGVLIQGPDPETNPAESLGDVQRIDRNVPVIFLDEHARLDEAAQLTKLGAFHVLDGKITTERVGALLDAAAEFVNLRRTPARKQEGEPWRMALIGESLPMQRITELIPLVARRRSTVLLTGETGTGKEVIARAIHAASDRCHAAMVAVNCSAIPEHLIEAELFGHVKGAFTGANQNRIGRFEQAHGGTLFLDEIGDLPLDLQAKLLRVLQEREIQRLGCSDTIKIDVRIIAATNNDLELAVHEKRFREDLFYRLNVVPLRLPPLRERSEDVPLLVTHFVEKICAVEGIPRKQVSRETLDCLRHHSWPGNIRQLEHAVEMAVVLSGERSTLYATDFALDSQASRRVAKESVVHVPDSGLNFDETVNRIERSIMEQAMSNAGGNKAKADDL